MVFEARSQTNRASSLLPSVFRASSKNYPGRSAKPHNTHPSSVIGWNTAYFGFEWLVVPFAFVHRSRSTGCLQREVFLTSCLWGGQLTDHEERSDEWDNLCLGVESLIQPLINNLFRCPTRDRLSSTFFFFVNGGGHCSIDPILFYFCKWIKM